MQSSRRGAPTAAGSAHALPSQPPGKRGGPSTSRRAPCPDGGWTATSRPQPATPSQMTPAVAHRTTRYAQPRPQRVHTRERRRTAGRRAPAIRLSITLRDRLERGADSSNRNKWTAKTDSRTSARRSRAPRRDAPQCGRSAHPLAAPTQILMRSSDPGGWPNLTQRIAVEPLAERE